MASKAQNASRWRLYPILLSIFVMLSLLAGCGPSTEDLAPGNRVFEER